MKKVVVTGGAGFIASHLVDALIEGGAEVLVIDNLSTGLRDNLTYAEKINDKNLKFIEADICSSETTEAIIGFRPDACFHLAAQANVRVSVDSPVFDATTNVLGTVNILEACRKAGTRKIVFSSTGGAIYGEQEYFPADEEHPISPECPYGVSKRCGELYLEHYAKKYEITSIAMRFGNVYGPRQNPKGEAGVVAIYIDRLRAGKSMLINGDGCQTRDLVYVKDVVSACIAACGGVKSGFNVFNVGLGIESSVNDIASTLGIAWKEINGSATTVTTEFAPRPLGKTERSVINPTKLKTIGWKPTVSLSEGLFLTVKSFV